MPTQVEIAEAQLILAQANGGTTTPNLQPRKQQFDWNSIDACIRAKDSNTGYDLLDTTGTLTATIKVAMTTAWKANGYGAIKWDWKKGELVSIEDPKPKAWTNSDMCNALVEDIIPMLFQLKFDAQSRSNKKAQERVDAEKSGYGEEGVEADIV